MLLKRSRIARFMVIGFCLVLALGVFAGCDDAGMEDVYNKIVEVHTSGTSDDLIELLPPGYYEHRIELICEKRGCTEQEADKSLEREYVPYNMADVLRVYDKDEYTMKNELLDQYTASDKEAEQLGKRLNEHFGVKGKVTDAVLIVYKIEADMAVEREYYSIRDAICVKIDGEWYIIESSNMYSQSIFMDRPGVEVEEIYIDWIYDWFVKAYGDISNKK